MVPDLIMNPHCFTGDTLISLPNGVAKRLDTLSEAGMEKVISWCPENKKSTMSYSVGLESKGKKDIIKLTLIDGRELKCTPDHKIKVLRNNEIIFKEANDIDFEDKLIMTPIGTEDKSYEEEDDWTLEFGNFKFNMENDRERERSLAFARILGYLTLSKNFIVNLKMDLNSIIDDIKLITGERPMIEDTDLGYKIINNFLVIENYPDFLFDKSCPKSIIREFLGGCFGGDTSSDNKTLTNIKFSETKLDKLTQLMKKLDVEAEVYREYEIRIKSNEDFRKNIGFRYSIQKLLKLELVCVNIDIECQINRTDNHFPNYYLGIMKKEEFGIEEVFDIGVMEYHLFSANGAIVSNCMPSRMTIGQLVEMTAAKIGAIAGHYMDGTPYCDYDVRKLPEMLEKLGFNKYGNEILYCGMTGKKIEAEIFMAPSYQIRLKHMTADKYHSRSRGPRQALTRQPLEGRSRDGGLKIGKPFCLKVFMQIKASPRCGGQHSLIAGNSRIFRKIY